MAYRGGERRCVHIMEKRDEGRKKKKKRVGANGELTVRLVTT